jgi:hypothetical protein
MAKRENWLALINENMAARAFIEGICEFMYHIMNSLRNKKIVHISKTNPRK